MTIPNCCTCTGMCVHTGDHIYCSTHQPFIESEPTITLEPGNPVVVEPGKTITIEPANPFPPIDPTPIITESVNPFPPSPTPQPPFIPGDIPPTPIQQGWTCPKCNSVYGPAQLECWRCNKNTVTCKTSNRTSTPISALKIRVTGKASQSDGDLLMQAGNIKEKRFVDALEPQKQHITPIGAVRHIDFNDFIEGEEMLK